MRVELKENSMKITPTILSIPPYLSTTWNNIAALRIESGSTLVVTLQNGTEVEVPNLEQGYLDAVFEAHTRYGGVQDSNVLLRPDIGSLTSALQHNPEQANLPPLPPEMLQKVGEMAKAMGLDDASVLPKAEPHCNCPYCQVVRAFFSLEEEEVNEEDLHFRDWDIEQSGDKLYSITNPLDQNEHYNVFLGEPLGCTCGQKNCEHIRAVLNT